MNRALVQRHNSQIPHEIIRHGDVEDGRLEKQRPDLVPVHVVPLEFAGEWEFPQAHVLPELGGVAAFAVEGALVKLLVGTYSMEIS